MIKNASAGWLITTGPLGKDAEGLRIEWENKPSDEKKKLIIYSSDRVIRLLLDNKVIINPEILTSKLPTEYCYNNRVRKNILYTLFNRKIIPKDTANLCIEILGLVIRYKID